MIIIILFCGSVIAGGVASSCTDSDNTVIPPLKYDPKFNDPSFYVMGNVKDSKGTHYDSCYIPPYDLPHLLTEYYCNQQGSLASYQYNCPVLCLNGQCIKCYDPDSKLDTDKYYSANTVFNYSGDKKTDTCLDQTNLLEYFCNNDGSIGSEKHQCNPGETCVKDNKDRGACYYCKESDGGNNPDVKGTVNTPFISRADECIINYRTGSSNSLIETYCNPPDLNPGIHEYTCNCKEGRCIDIRINLQDPKDKSQITTYGNNNGEFNARFENIASMKNATIYIWDSNNKQVSLPNNPTVSGSFPSISSGVNLNKFPSGTYKWNYQACDIYGYCYWNSTNWTFTYTRPTALASLGSNSFIIYLIIAVIAIIIIAIFFAFLPKAKKSRNNNMKRKNKRR